MSGAQARDVRKRGISPDPPVASPDLQVRVVDRRREGAQSNLTAGERHLRDLFDDEAFGRASPPNHNRPVSSYPRAQPAPLRGGRQSFTAGAVPCFPISTERARAISTPARGQLYSAVMVRVRLKTLPSAFSMCVVSTC